MSVGIVSDDEFLAELNKLGINKTKINEGVIEGEVSEEIEGEVKESVHRGRKEGDNNVPDKVRQLIGEESVINGRQYALELAKEFGLSPSSVSAYAHGATSTASYQSPSKSIISHINKSREKYARKAGRVLGVALSQITEDKLQGLGARHLAGIAKDMSATIKNLEPPKESGDSAGNNNRPQFVVFAPQFRDERSYEVIDVQKDEI